MARLVEGPIRLRPPERRAERRPRPSRRGFERRRTKTAPQPASSSLITGGIPRPRVRLMRAVVVLVFAALTLRLVGVQVLSSGRYSSIGAGQFATTAHVLAVRGGIFDRNGTALAVSIPRDTIVADPYLIQHPDVVAARLAPMLKVPKAQLVSELSEHSGFVYLAKKVGQGLGQQIGGLGLPGINVMPDTERVDPDGTMANSLVGGVNAAGAGSSGLEYQFNSLLAGQTGVASEQVAPDGVALPGKTVTHSGAVPGSGVELSIDAPLQYVTEQSLGAEVLASHAKSGIAIVMNTHTGQILSMANLVAKTTPAPVPPSTTTTTSPSTTTSTPGATTTTTAPPPPPPPITTVVQAAQNLALTRVYEPGSVFKLVTFSAALQDGIITPDEVFTVPNALTIDGWVFHDAETHPTERLTATQILAQSSNIGTIEIAQQLGEGRLAAQVAALGFGRTTGLHFPAESAGLVKSNPASWQVSDIGATPIGQDDAVTAQQVLDMVNTVATGGVYVPPQLVRARVSPDGILQPTAAGRTHRAISSVVASQLTTMMEQVVQDGTAVSAGIPGYTVAGKTGTAQIPDLVHGGYIPGQYVATFAGFAPAENPQLSAIVVLQQPSPIFGGIVAAPVFSQIMRYALHRYDVPTSPGGGTTGGDPQPVPFGPMTTATSTPAATTTPTTIVASPGTPAKGP